MNCDKKFFMNWTNHLTSWIWPINTPSKSTKSAISASDSWPILLHIAALSAETIRGRWHPRTSGYVSIGRCSTKKRTTDTHPWRTFVEEMKKCSCRNGQRKPDSKLEKKSSASRKNSDSVEGLRGLSLSEERVVSKVTSFGWRWRKRRLLGRCDERLLLWCWWLGPPLFVWFVGFLFPLFSAPGRRTNYYYL